MTLVHASCVAIDGDGVLLRGPSGSGKSDLALRLIEAGGQLVADDQVELTAAPGAPWPIARAPQALADRIEVRGIGIISLAGIAEAPVTLVDDLVAPRAVERLPHPRSCVLEGHTVSLVAIAPFEASAPAKVRLAARRSRHDSNSAP